MTRLGQALMSGAMVALALVLAISTHTGSDDSRPETWGSSPAIMDHDPGFWRARPAAVSVVPRAYSAGMSSLVAVSRITVLPDSGLALTNFGAAGVLVVESGGLILTDAEGLVELQRGAGSEATGLAPLGIGSRLQRGDRIAFRSSATMAFRNREPETAASILMTSESLDLPSGGARQ